MPHLTPKELDNRLEKAKKEADLCPECGEHSLVFEEGCAKCYSCGHAEC